jgi:hypothetical protein
MNVYIRFGEGNHVQSKGTLEAPPRPSPRFHSTNDATNYAYHHNEAL